jgi:hypothetical protein
MLMSNTVPIEKLNKHKHKVASLVDQWTRIEIGLRTGFLTSADKQPKGGLSLVNDMADCADQLRKILYGTSDIFELGKMFGFKQPKPKPKRKSKKRSTVKIALEITKSKQEPKEIMTLIRKLDRATSKTEKRQIRASLRRLNPQWLRYRK